MKKCFLLIIALLLLNPAAKADEGMWLLPLLQKMNVKDMKAKGLKLSVKDIYDLNKQSLKDAIVIFGNGCTGEIVSADGLLFTNHHCGYGSIQQLSSVEHDYLKNGFWAMNRQEEIPAPGLSVRFIRHIEDVTDEVLKGVNDTMDEEQRDAAIGLNISNIRGKIDPFYPGMTVQIKDFFGGNQFLMFAIEQYNDVRLVGAPPTSIGKFGGETDNWMWPRHTGDFSVFRVYSDVNGKPAEFSRDNIPYKAPVHLKVSLKGFEQGDFAMIMGFPGSTNRYMTSYEIDYTLDVDNPNRIKVRGERQEILKAAMNASDEIRIKYASKYASSSNYWKNSIGMSRGLEKLNVRAKKQLQEEDFIRWVNNDPSRMKYSKSLDLIKNAVEGRAQYKMVAQYLSETMVRAVEIITASAVESIISNEENIEGDILDQIQTISGNFYKDYDSELDRKVAKRMFALLKESIDSELLPSVYDIIDKDFGGSTDSYVDYLYDNSVFANQDKFQTYLDSNDFSNIEEDPAVVLRRSVIGEMQENLAKSREYDQMFKEGHRLYIAGLMEMGKGKMHYPDANFTIRLTYGNILPYTPADAVIYNYYSTLSGVMAKEDPNSTEFVVPQKLKELYATKDFGRYAYKGDVPVGFLSNNDITGGNSGSPVLNGKGELIGLAFDGNWEAMSGDIAFEPELQRCINVDIRYVLFVIDKFAGAGYLLDEMTIVN